MMFLFSSQCRGKTHQKVGQNSRWVDLDQPQIINHVVHCFSFAATRSPRFVSAFISCRKKLLPAKQNRRWGTASAVLKPHQVPVLTSGLIAYTCEMKFFTFLFAVETARKMEMDHSACMSVPETLARKQELFLVQILLLRVCCCKNYDYVPSPFSPLLRRGMPDRSVALHKL